MARMRGIHADVIRGSIGGNTFFANQFHQILVRARTSPVNPNTQAQGLIRGAMSSTSVLYEQLSAGDKQLWQDYADTLHFSNPLGPIQVPGRQVCLGNCSTARYLDDRGIAMGQIGAAPPQVPGFLDLSNVSTSAPIGAGTGFSVSFTTAETEGIEVYAFRSFAFNTGRFRYKGPFLTASLQSNHLVGAQSGFIDFINLIADQVYFCVVRSICHQNPFRMGAPHYARAVAVTTP